MLASESHEVGSTTDPTLPWADEAKLIRKALEGDTRAFGEIVHVHHLRVFNFLRQMTRHHHDAEDLTQQTFLKAFHHLGTFNQGRPLANWLLTIARNSALNHFRAAKKWTEVPENVADDEPSPARAAEISDRAANVWERARAVLPQREFEVLWLRFAEDLSVKETADVVGLTQTHVKVLVFRARQALAKGEHSL